MALAHDTPAVHRVLVISDVRQIPILLGHKQGNALVAQSGERRDEILNHPGRETQEGLVEDEHASVGEDRAPDGDHLLLSSAERTSLLSATVDQVGKHLKDLLKPSP